MIRLIPRTEPSKAMIFLSPLLALALTALTAFFIFTFILTDIEVSSVFFTLFVAVSYTHLTLPTKRIV